MSVSINVADDKAAALQLLANNLSAENLKMLGEVSKKANIDAKIKKYTWALKAL